MPSCVVQWCLNLHRQCMGISFHLFPKDKNQRKLWIDAIRLERREKEWTPRKKSCVCSLHFKDDDFYMTKRGNLKLKRNVLPLCTMVLNVDSEVASSNTENLPSMPSQTLQPTYISGNILENSSTGIISDAPKYRLYAEGPDGGLIIFPLNPLTPTSTTRSYYIQILREERNDEQITNFTLSQNGDEILFPASNMTAPIISSREPLIKKERIDDQGTHCTVGGDGVALCPVDKSAISTTPLLVPIKDERIDEDSDFSEDVDDSVNSYYPPDDKSPTHSPVSVLIKQENIDVKDTKLTAAVNRGVVMPLSNQSPIAAASSCRTLSEEKIHEYTIEVPISFPERHKSKKDSEDKNNTEEKGIIQTQQLEIKRLKARNVKLMVKMKSLEIKLADLENKFKMRDNNRMKNGKKRKEDVT